MTARVAVIGAGVAGAMAAYRLKKAGLKPVVYEASDYIGGRARTVRKNGFIFDTGAVGLLGSYERTREVAHEIGLGPQFLTLKPMAAVPRDGVLRYLDMAHPIRSFLFSDLFSLRSKLTLLMVVADVLRLRGKIDYQQIEALVPHDIETVREYSLRRLNEELYRYLSDPLTRGAWLAPSEQASVIQFFWTAKHFTPHMYSMMGGMDALPVKLLEGVELHLETRVLNVDEQADQVQISCAGKNGEATHRFDACILAVPPEPALRAFPGMRAEQRAALERARYSRSVNVHLGLSRKPDHPEMYAMVPKCECEDITTIFLDHHKAPDRAPDGKGIISVFLRAEWCAANYETDDLAVLESVLAMLRRYYGDLEPLLEHFIVQRWEHCARIVTPGTFGDMSAYDRAVDPRRLVQIAGDFAPFSSVNTAVVSGEKAAARVMARLLQH